MNCATGQNKDKKPPNQELNRPNHPPKFADLLHKMDKNKDGKLSESELEGPLKKDFKKVDINKDGYITEEELKKAPPPIRK